MRRVLSFALVICMLLSLVAIPVSALDSAESESALSVLNNYSCEYNRQTGAVVLSGTVKHNALISHKQYTVEIYRVTPGETLEGVMSAEGAAPIAKAEIASRFEFSLKTSTLTDRFSRYAIVLCSPKGERALAAPLLYAASGAYAEYASERISFKGIATSEHSLAGTLEPGTAILPIDLGRLLQNTSYGLMHQIGDKTFYLDKTYVYEIDRVVRGYSATGTKVYLNLLIPSGDSRFYLANGKPMGASYDMPNVYSPDVLAAICACSEFLAARFSTYQGGFVSGVIVGGDIDDPMMNYCGSLSLERYAEIYSLYLMAVTSSVRAYLPTADVIVPFGDADTYGSDEGFGGVYAPDDLLEALLSVLDASLTTPLSFGTSVRFYANKKPEGLSADRVGAYSQFLVTLRDRFASAPTHYMASWNVPSDMGSTAMCANYAYAYYRLFADPTLSSFVVSFSASEAEGTYRLEELKQIFRWIDTEESLNVTASLPSYFGKTHWRELVDYAETQNYGTQTTLSMAVGEGMELSMAGSFSYFDFEGGHIEDWFAGDLAEGLKSEYGREGKRALRANLSPSPSTGYGELFCLYEFPERFAHTPYLDFSMALAEESGDRGGLYSVMITLGNDSVRAVAQTVLDGGSLRTVRVSMDSFPSDQTVSYVRISIRQISGEEKTVSFRLYDVTGHSPTLSSEELAEVIGKDRMSIRNLTDGEGDGVALNELWIIGAVVLVAAIFIGIFVCFKRDEDGEDGDEPTSDENHHK